jgi:4-methyl-5(b-hydroxyethyl)-thiazole monophosphate biosynthesis
MAKKAIIILAQGFEEIEAVTAIDILRRADIDLTVAGLDSQEVKGAHDLVIKADKRLAEAGEDFDACILPGGMPGATNLAASERLDRLIKRLHKQGKIVAAICASPAIVLAASGVLDNKAATCYPGMEENFGPTTRFKEDTVAIDGNIITSRGPATALPFALAVVEKLSGPETKERVKKATLFDLL